MKKLISDYIEDNYIISIKELAIVKAHLAYTKCDTFKDELSLVRADLLEDIEKDLLLHRGYSITTKQELMLTIEYVLDGIVEEYANSILDSLNVL